MTLSKSAGKCFSTGACKHHLRPWSVWCVHTHPPPPLPVHTTGQYEYELHVKCYMKLCSQNERYRRVSSVLILWRKLPQHHKFFGRERLMQTHQTWSKHKRLKRTSYKIFNMFTIPPPLNTHTQQKTPVSTKWLLKITDLPLIKAVILLSIWVTFSAIHFPVPMNS